MPLILGIAGRSEPGAAACSTDAADPALDRFVCGAWADHVSRNRGALGSIAPGLYPLTLQVDYEVVGREVIRAHLQTVEGARAPGIERMFEKAMEETGRLQGGPFRFPEGVRCVRTTVLLEVPKDAGLVPRAAPELTASFASAVRQVLGRLARTCDFSSGDHVLDLHVTPVGDQWLVEPARPPSRVLSTFLMALHQAGLLAEGDLPEEKRRVSLLLRSRSAQG